MPHILDSMPEARYQFLQDNPDADLTMAERMQGYRFCCEWDGLLIHATHPEADCCKCLGEYRKQHGIIKGE